MIDASFYPFDVMKRFSLLFVLSSIPVYAGESEIVLPENVDSGSGAKSGMLDDGAKSGLLRDSGAKGGLLPEPAATLRPWRLRVWRRLGGTSISSNFQGSSFNDRFFVPAFESGSATEVGDRSYDNGGFVNVGAGTAATGLTSHFGYPGGATISGDNLLFSRSGGTALDFPSSGSSSDDTVAAPYFELAYLRPIRPNVEFGFVGNFSYAELDSSISERIGESSITTEDRYALNGVIPPTGGYVGPFSGPGPLILNIPTERTQNFTPNGSRTHRFESDTDLYSFAFGTEVSWKANERMYLGLGGGVVMNIADWEASSEVPMIAPGTTQVESVRFTESDDEFLWGFYLKASMGYQFNERWGIDTFYRYDWNESLTGNVGPTEFKVDLTGWSTGLSVTYSF